MPVTPLHNQNNDNTRHDLLCQIQHEVVPGILFFLDAASDYPVVALLGKGQGVLRDLTHIVVNIEVLHR